MLVSVRVRVAVAAGVGSSGPPPPPPPASRSRGRGPALLTSSTSSSSAGGRPAGPLTTSTSSEMPPLPAFSLEASPSCRKARPAWVKSRAPRQMARHGTELSRGARAPGNIPSSPPAAAAGARRAPHRPLQCSGLVNNNHLAGHIGVATAFVPAEPRQMLPPRAAGPGERRGCSGWITLRWGWSGGSRTAALVACLRPLRRSTIRPPTTCPIKDASRV